MASSFWPNLTTCGGLVCDDSRAFAPKSCDVKCGLVYDVNSAANRYPAGPCRRSLTARARIYAPTANPAAPCGTTGSMVLDVDMTSTGLANAPRSLPPFASRHHEPG